jgi:hypothetical protein
VEIRSICATSDHTRNTTRSCDAARPRTPCLLATARRTYRDLNPGVSAKEASETVTCAADALFVILEQAGLLGDAIDSRLADNAARGMAVGGWRAQVVINEPHPLSPEPRRDCLHGGDVFALPTRDHDN